MCFSNAFEARSDTVCANMRQGNKLPIGHITARSVASWIHLQQVETALGERERPWSPHIQEQMYLPAPGAVSE